MNAIQIDSHPDLHESYEGGKNNYACIMARTMEVCPVLQEGIRSNDIGEKPNVESSRVFWAHNITGNRDLMDKAIDLLTENN